MIIESIFLLIFKLIELIISLFPNINMIEGSGVNATFTLVSYGLMWFPLDLWIAILANIIFWLSVQGGWIVIEWVYKKVPGVD